MELGVLKFKPILKEKVWGGEKLGKVLHKETTSDKTGESWEITAVKGNISVVAEGKEKGKKLTELIQTHKGDLMGNKVFNVFGDQFPLLIKYIDAKEALSIQLHPNDELAKQRHQSFGKTEMWYVMQADKDAELIVGFKEKVSKETYLDSLDNNTIKQLLNVDKVSEGDVYFIPTGLVHAIGAGVMLAEIQQTSDITYRIYDWDRRDDQGNTRELHTEEALDAIDFSVKDSYRTSYKKVDNASQNIVDCPYFTTNIVKVTKDINVDHNDKDSFVIYMCVSGGVTFKYNGDKEARLHYGETVLIPNNLKTLSIIPDEESELLEVYIK